MWFAELLAGLLHGFGDLAAGKKGRLVVIAMTVVVAIIIAYVVVA